jgi:hypothetical protein
MVMWAAQQAAAPDTVARAVQSMTAVICQGCGEELVRRLHHERSYAAQVSREPLGGRKDQLEVSQ